MFAKYRKSDECRKTFHVYKTGLNQFKKIPIEEHPLEENQSHLKADFSIIRKISVRVKCRIL